MEVNLCVKQAKVKGDRFIFSLNKSVLFCSLKYGIESAFVWWSLFKVNQAIDEFLSARTMSDIEGPVSDISMKVNGGIAGLSDRIHLFEL
ncbi:hypothetical protein [Pseudomonas frederiksbergensis]|uniref:hypothetical protein n=1 Tax=Pseudomonas frederiksbergensis TaxID=104087 RepID=UPI0011CE8F9D|nr:hypothetical protein [Pseudomonas frederiksbergensis]